MSAATATGSAKATEAALPLPLRNDGRFMPTGAPPTTFVQQRDSSPQ